MAGHIHAFLGKELDAAVDMFDRALRVNENSAFAWGISASTYCFLGQPDEALERLRNAWQLSPFDPLNFWFYTVAGIAEFVVGRYAEAVDWLRKAQRLNPRFLACHRRLTASLALLGDSVRSFCSDLAATRSPTLRRAVPWALRRFTAGFGMEPGGAVAL